MDGLDRALWRAARDAALERDGHTCTLAELDPEVWCSPGPLHGHHLDPSDDPYDPENVSMVCAAHHARWEAFRRRLERLDSLASVR